MERWWVQAVTCGIGLATALPAGAQIPMGGEFQINSYTTNAQSEPSVAMGDSRDFVVVWESNGSAGGDTSSTSIQGQRYASDGSVLGGQFQVNTYTTSFQVDPSVAAAPDGDFVVVWESNGSSGGDTGGTSIQGQLYASDGSPLGGQFQINTYTTSYQGAPSVGRFGGKDFAVVWQSNGSSGTDTSGYSIQGRRYASTGSALGSQFQVNTYTSSSQGRPVIDLARTAGWFVVVWQSDGSSGTDTNGYSIQGQLHASNASKVGSQFQVNTHTAGGQYSPSVANHDEGFAVVWDSVGSAGTDTSSKSIQGQRYEVFASAAPLGGEFQVNTYTTNSQSDPSVAMEIDGEFVVAWHSDGSDGTDVSAGSVQAQRYASDGSALGEQLQVNTYTTNTQQFASVAAEDQEFVVVWTSTGSSGTDSNLRSIQGQRYLGLVAQVPSLSPSTAAAAALLMLAAVAVAFRKRG